MRRFHSFQQRSVAIFLSLSLILFNSVSFAAPLPSSLRGSIPSEAEAISIPEALGRIEESYLAPRSPNHDPRPKTIIYIQDAHDSLEAQENIAKIIHHLVEHYGVKTVLEEGYEGPVPTDEYFGLIKDPKVKEKVSYFLMDKLRLGGAEYAHINRCKFAANRSEPAKKCGGDFQLIGADNIKLHLENISWYQKMAQHKEETQRDLEAIFTEIRKLANQYFPKELKEWLKLKERFDEKKLSLLDYLRRTMALTRHPEPQNIKRGGEGSQILRRPEGLLRMTTGTPLRNGVVYPNISLLLQAENATDKELIDKVKTIDYRTLFQEIDRLENDFALLYLKNERDQKIFGYLKGLELLKRLTDIQLSFEEYDLTKTLLQELRTEALAQFLAQTTQKSVVLSKRWEENIQKAIKFYETAESRDVAIEKKLDQFLDKPDENVAILVFGGFHKNQIQEILKRKGVSHLLISPKINQLDGKHKDYYRQLMSVGHLPFEIPVNVAKASRAANFYERAERAGSRLARTELEVISGIVGRGLHLDFPILDQQITERLGLRDEISESISVRSEVRAGQSHKELQIQSIREAYSALKQAKTEKRMEIKEVDELVDLKAGLLQMRFPLPDGTNLGRPLLSIGTGLNLVSVRLALEKRKDGKLYFLFQYEKQAGAQGTAELYWDEAKKTLVRRQDSQIQSIREAYSALKQAKTEKRMEIKEVDELVNLKAGLLQMRFPLPDGTNLGRPLLSIGTGRNLVSVRLALEKRKDGKLYFLFQYEKQAGAQGTAELYWDAKKKDLTRVQSTKDLQIQKIRAAYKKFEKTKPGFKITLDDVNKLVVLKKGLLQRTFPLPNGLDLGEQKRIGTGQDLTTLSLTLEKREDGKTHFVFNYTRADGTQGTAEHFWDEERQVLINVREVDVDAETERLGLVEAVALLGHDPLKLQQYIRLYYPELSPEEMDRIVVASIRGVGGERVEEEELHLNYEEVLSAPRVEQDVKATKGHSFILSGRAPAEASHIQVVGAYTRRILVRQDRTFSANIPLPKTGDLNEFQIYAFNPTTEQKSPSVSVQVRQTGEKEDLEESFLRLLALKEEVLDAILKEPGRYQFLLRSVEQSLLKQFTYSDEAGLRYLRQRIREEKPRSQKVILTAILRKFEEIKDMEFSVKGGERLYFFQKYTIYEIRKLMEEGVKGVIIANEQGLGKTVTALEAVNGKDTVILTPNSVVSTWLEEDEKFFPQANLDALEGDYQERMKALTKVERPYLVTNIEFTRGMSPRRATLLSRPQGVLVVDEGDYLGSKTSQQSQGTRQIEAGFRLLLTATPFKRVSQIGHILSFLYPNDPRYGSARAFARAFPTDKREALNALFALMNRHTIRIRKQDVFDYYDPNVPLEQQSDRLPKKAEIPPEEEGRFYLTEIQAESILELFTQYQRWSRKHRGHESVEDKQYYRYREGYFSKREALRQIMDDPAYIGRPELESPKHLAMDKIVARELGHDPHKKILIFTRYRAQVEEYLRRYAAYGARAYYGGLRANANGYKIDPEGKVLDYKVDEYENFVLENGEFIPSDKEHGRPIRALDYERILFQNNPASRVMVATYDTGALGVTFTAADAVVFDNLAPTYRDQYQAADRAHRIDNKRKKYEVKYYWLQALYPKSFLDKLDRETRESYFSMGTFDQVHFENLKRQAHIFHRVMDGVGSEREVASLHQHFMSERMPFLFAAQEAEDETFNAGENETPPKRAEVRESPHIVLPDFKPYASLNHLQGRFTVFADLDDVANLTDEQLTEDYEKIAIRHKNVSFVFYNDQQVISKEIRTRLEKLQGQLGSHRIQITQGNAQSVFTRQWRGELIHVSKRGQLSLRGSVPDKAEAISEIASLTPFARNDVPRKKGLHRFRYLGDETGLVPVALLYVNTGNKGFENRVIDLSMVDGGLVAQVLAYQASLVFARSA